MIYNWKLTLKILIFTLEYQLVGSFTNQLLKENELKKQEFIRCQLAAKSENCQQIIPK